MGKKYRQCTRCVMDTTDPLITFDRKGVCSNCTNYFAVAARLPTTPIEQVVEQIRSRARGRPYDAVMGISGGFDSSYAAYIAYRQGLRVYLIHVDDGWDTEAAVTNVRQIVKNTGWDFEPLFVAADEYRDLLLAYLRASVVGLEVPTDNGLVAAIYRVAKDRRVKNILTGRNWVTEGIRSQAWGYDNEDVTNMRAIHRRFGELNHLSNFPTISLLQRIWLQKGHDCRTFNILYHVPYNREEAKKKLAKEWGLVDYGRKHQENRFTNFVENYIFPLKFGIDKRLMYYSTLICSRQMTRTEALRQLKRPMMTPDEIKREREFFIRKLWITDDELERILRLPPRSHFEFPTHHRVKRLLRWARGVVGD